MNPETLAGAEQDYLDFNLEGFDVNAAFQGALSDIISDDELTLTEKVTRTESILETGQSEMYRAFVDFRALAAQIEDCSNHNHELDEGMQSSEAISSFTAKHGGDDEHDHPIRGGADKDKWKKKKRHWIRSGWLKYFVG